MKFRFENLQVWQAARNFANHIYSLTRSFPSTERFGLIDQLRRAAVSIALNIAEGSDRKSDIEFRRYLRMAIASTEEVVTALFIALDQKYLSQSNFDKLYEEAHMIVAKLNALIKKLSDYRLPTTAAEVGSRKSVDGKHQRGFTLIELLITISIIAILSAIGFSIYQGIQAKARDSIRKHDLNNLATALEIYYQKNNTYPIPSQIINNGNTAWSDQTTSTWAALANALVPNFIDQLPQDPKNGGTCCGSDWYVYAYVILNSGQSYRLCANQENKNNQDINVSPGNTCAPPAAPFFGYYKVESP